MSDSELKKYMTPAQRKAIGNQPTWHCNMIEATGVARAGKTAKERAKREREENK